MRPYKYDPNDPFEANVNLSALLQEVKNGKFKTLTEVNKEFAEILRSVSYTKQLAKEAFAKSSTCECKDCDRVQYSLRKNILYHYYHFEKRCKWCHKIHYVELTDWDEDMDFPEGYENANKTYWDLS